MITKNLPPKNLFTWVGLKNFSNVITGDMASTFFPVLAWTLTWAVLATITCFFFGVILALLINAKGIRYKKLWRNHFCFDDGSSSIRVTFDHA